MATRDSSVLPGACFKLNALGIKATYDRSFDVLCVDRTSMVNVSRRGDEGACYDDVAAFLQAEYPQHHVMWSGRTDEWMSVDFYKRGGSHG